eukprot:TRINITY_DN23308_c0_g1_i4.p1 TRINITY_DN23308_c0_g1~~TRINITY_DN23308_c0_g1_i4.p1  ORF type:complete len:762 (+),score=125.72 TRINITY_DN23308_c0_g1_i4:399-2684(+)
MSYMFAHTNFDQFLAWNLWSLDDAINFVQDSKANSCFALHLWNLFSASAVWKAGNQYVLELSKPGCPRCNTTSSCPSESLACYDEMCRPMYEGFIYMQGEGGPTGLRSTEGSDLHCQGESCKGLVFEPSRGWIQLSDAAKVDSYHDDVLLRPSCAAYSCQQPAKVKESATNDFNFSFLSCCSCAEAFEYMLADGTCSTCRAGNAVQSDGRGCETCPRGRFSADAASTCSECPVGTYGNESGSNACPRCPSDQVSGIGQDQCYPCGLLQTAEKGGGHCIFDYLQFVELAGLAICACGMLKAAAANLKLRIPVEDVTAKRWVIHDKKENKSREVEATVLTTCSRHGLHNYKGSSLPLQLSGTANPGLDGKCFLAHVEDDRHLRLLDRNGQDMNGFFDTSAGELNVCFGTAMRHRGWPLPNSVLITMLGCTAGYLLVTTKNCGLSLMAVIVPASLVLIAEFVTRWDRFRMKHHPLRMALFRFQQLLPAPTRCPKGAARGIGLSALLQLKDTFDSFICNRSAYYLAANIIIPLAKPEKISYAELAGPRAADWFVSHYWGTPFRHFCDSLAKHASGASQVLDPAYWICFCANSQFNIAGEIGNSVQESSFFLALQGGVKGTCLVLDEKALPLTRSWCIYEMLQTFKLENNIPDFGLHFCTTSGVLNRGEGSADLVSNLGEQIAVLDMEQSTASDPKDDRLIKESVISSMGSFVEMNNIIRRKMMDIIVQASQQQNRKLARVHDLLQPIQEGTSDMVVGSPLMCETV